MTPQWRAKSPINDQIKGFSDHNTTAGQTHRCSSPCCVGLQLLHPSLHASLPALSQRVSPAQLLGQEKPAGSSTCAGAILLEKSRALQEMWCPQQYLGWCWWRLGLSKHLECPELEMGGPSLVRKCCSNRLKCQCWLRALRWPHKHRAGFPGQAPHRCAAAWPGYSRALWYLILWNNSTRNGKAAGHQQLPALHCILPADKLKLTK